MRKDQILNSITMIFPMIALLRNVRRRSTFKVLSLIHVPVSSLYHFLASCLRNDNKWVLCLRYVDYFFIHTCSHVAYREQNNLKSNVLILLHVSCVSLLLKTGRDQSILRSSLMLYEHRRSFKTSANVLTGMMCVILYCESSRKKYLHCLFHMTLYMIYREYFKRLAQ